MRQRQESAEQTGIEQTRINDALAEYLLRDAPAAVLLLTRDGWVRDANKTVKREIDEHAVGKRFADLLVEFGHAPELSEILQREDTRQMLNFSTAEGLPQTYYFRFIDLDELVLAVGELDGGESSALRQNLVEMNNEFSNLNRELQKKNAELEKLNNLKNRFLGMAAHDLRNPLASICSLSAFLMDNGSETLGADRLELLKLIRESSDFVLSLVDDLLSIARIEAGRIDLDARTADLAELLRRNVSLSNIVAKERGVSIALQHTEEIPEFPFDSVKINQVLNNLLGNAVKFSPDNATITVALFTDAEHAIISITDEGPGIAEADLTELFTPFHKSSTKAYTQETSTGLGLYIVQRIVLAHGGRIWVDTTRGEGSTFYVSLPLRPVERADAAASSQP